MRSCKSIVALTLLVTLLAPLAVQARAYQTFTVDVPFEFNIGDRKFKPGTYIFVIVGTGLMALENAKKHALATLITRDIQSAASSSPSPHLSFERRKGHTHLVSLWMTDGKQGLEIVGEQVAMRQASPFQAPPELLEQQLLMLRAQHMR